MVRDVSGLRCVCVCVLIGWKSADGDGERTGEEERRKKREIKHSLPVRYAALGRVGSSWVGLGRAPLLTEHNSHLPHPRPPSPTNLALGVDMDRDRWMATVFLLCSCFVTLLAQMQRLYSHG